ncbi:hypothetical protein BA895_11935 [Humibacillus sp. DSM 29435]|uniref:DUF1906 domain-containing protein n=1 Tax=Humibacillus sp. DSM 29435 TaxID=1869167 RepID=UPI0008724CC3|nr:DUF1906 domain-containing protein [Humibacillus sp. DSM 29435]OFE18342.1 hypothetical protein BA895_11935 [Humibacillus sp. DSM 29435]
MAGLLAVATLASSAAGTAAAASSLSPGSYAGGGFDHYTAPAQSLMTAWRASSPYRAVGIYIGGDNRYDTVQANLTPQWVSTQQSAGWHLLPIYLGPQPYCTTSTKPIRFSATNAASLGTSAANDAVVRARALGLSTGSTIYNDIEAYSTTDPACTTAVLTFQSHWTQRLHALGFFSGFYSSLGSGVRDQVAAYNSTAYVRPDYLWFARYDGLATVSDAAIPDTYWVHRRIKQYRGGAAESYGGQTLDVDRNQLDVTAPGGFLPLSPSRLLDTRSGVGAAKAAVAPGGTVHLQVTGRGGVPASGVSAVVLNVTATAPTASGYVTAYGEGATRPTVSNLNFVKAQTVANLVIVPVGAGGKVALYNGSRGTAHLIADVSGYAIVNSPMVAGALGPLSPSRLLDTRIGVGAARAAVAPGGTVHLQVTGRGGVPASGVSAVVLNVTATAPTASGYVTAFAEGATRPTVSNLNFVKAQTVANLVIVPVGAGGKVALYNGSRGTAQLIADVSGYYVAGTPTVTAPGGFLPLNPSRLLDTRSGVGAAKAAVAPGGTVHLQVTGRGGVPASGVSAVVLNVTVTDPTSAGYLTVYGEGATRPTVSNLNFVKAQTVPNLVIVPVGAGGKVALYNGSHGTTSLIADVWGSF